MRAFIAGLTLAVASMLASSTPALADHTHLHCLTTPGARTDIAGGLTANAPHDAFSRFHVQVHFGAFANPDNPVSLGAVFTGSCPQ
jgi:hypothetical protein